VHVRGTAEKPVSSDHVQLTNLSAYLAAAQSDSPARLGRLFQLHQAVSSGGYHVDAGLVSHSIIEDSLRAVRA
jgi:anti-sigma28 factor (negative regulator of flagellin synthesis)